MKKARYNEEQIVRILRKADRNPMADVARRHGVSEQSIYGWRKRYGEFGVDEVRRLKEIETENARLRKLLVERDLEIEAMKEVNRRKTRHAAISSLRQRARICISCIAGMDRVDQGTETAQIDTGKSWQNGEF